MRQPLIRADTALRERLVAHGQVPPDAPEAEMPPYLESFLAHLRLLIGAPFEYLVPDARLLPLESIRFFYLDRSWTDRLIDGAIAVGKMGTREQAHHAAQADAIESRLDGMEQYVRDLQRDGTTYEAARNAAVGQAGVVTGFLLRSAAVAGWPHMEVRAFSEVLPENPDLQSDVVTKASLSLLRLELLSPSVLLALFDGIPRLVWCEEPHHGVQFAVKEIGGRFELLRRSAQGVADHGPPLPVPFRVNDHRVIHITHLRQALARARNAPGGGNMPAQNGSADFAVEVLDVPWRQRFQGIGGVPQVTGSRVFTSRVSVVEATMEERTAQALRDVVQQP